MIFLINELIMFFSYLFIENAYDTIQYINVYSPPYISMLVIPFNCVNCINNSITVSKIIPGIVILKKILG